MNPLSYWDIFMILLAVDVVSWIVRGQPRADEDFPRLVFNMLSFFLVAFVVWGAQTVVLS